MVMFDKKTLLRNFERAAKEEEKRKRSAELRFNIGSFNVPSWSESAKACVSLKNCKHEKVNGIYPFITCIDCGKGMDKKPHYKWSWKLNKAVRL